MRAVLKLHKKQELKLSLLLYFGPQRQIGLPWKGV